MKYRLLILVSEYYRTPIRLTIRFSVMNDESGRHLPLFLLMQALLGIPLKKYFPKYNADYLYNRLGGYFKAFREYYEFRVVHVLGEMKRIIVDVDDGHHPRRVLHDKSLEISILTEYFLVFLQVMMDQVAVFVPFFYEAEENHKSLVHRKIEKKSRSSDDVYVDTFMSFAQIRYAFQNNTDIDVSFTRYLRTRLDWFHDVNRRRNSLIHGSGWLWLDYNDDDRDPRFRNVQGYMIGEEWNPSVKEYVAWIYYNFQEFLSCFEGHFRRKGEQEFEEFTYREDRPWYPGKGTIEIMDYFYNEGKKLVEAVPNQSQLSDPP